MSVEHLGTLLLAWSITYLVHSTLLLGAGWLCCRALPPTSMRLRERTWKLVLVAGLFTSSLQIGMGRQPWLGQWRLDGAAPAPTVLVEAADTTSAGEPARAQDSAPTAEAAELATGQARSERTPAGAEWPASEPGLRLSLGASGPAGLRSALLPWLEALRPTPASEAVPAEARSDAARSAAQTRLEPSSSNAAGASQGAVAGIPGLWIPSAAWSLAWVSLPALDWNSPILFTWLAVTGLGLAGLWMSWRALRRELKTRCELREGALVDVLAELCRRAGLRRRVRLSCSTQLVAPVAFGWLRPEICVPVRAAAGLSREQQRSMLAHELAHLLRRDPLWLVGSRVLERVLFFQPLNRLARKRLEDAAEYLCDDWAVEQTGDGLALASCLAEIAGWLVPNARARSLRLASGIAARPSRLSARVERLLSERAREGSTPWLAPGALGLCGLLVLAAPGASASKPGERADGLDAGHLEPETRSGLYLDSGEPHLPARLALSGLEPIEVDGDEAGAVLAELDRELDLLQGEIRGLRLEFEDSQLAERFSALLSRLEGRARELYRRRARLRELLQVFEGSTAFAAESAPIDEPLTIPFSPSPN